MQKKTSVTMRENPLFMRNEFPTAGRWNIPIIRRQEVDLTNVGLIAYNATKRNDSLANRQQGVHFFIDDYRFGGVYWQPERSLKKLSQYAFVLTPDFSTYLEMNMWRQMESVAHSRWCGAYWQSRGLTVIATISWSSYGSYEFCFAGVERGSVVAVSMNGSKNDNHASFMRGYNAMLEAIAPSAIICLGKPFPEMKGDIVVVPYIYPRKKVE